MNPATLPIQPVRGSGFWVQARAVHRKFGGCGGFGGNLKKFSGNANVGNGTAAEHAHLSERLWDTASRLSHLSAGDDSKRSSDGLSTAAATAGGTANANHPTGAFGDPPRCASATIADAERHV